MLRSALLGLAFLWVVFSLSQTDQADRDTVLQEYKEALSIYNEATTLSTSPHYSEEKETALNVQALQRFKALHQKLAAPGSLYDSLTFHTSYFIGELEHYFERHSEALTWYQQAIERHQRARLPDSLLFKPFVYSGIICYNQNKLDTAARLFYKAESIQQQYAAPLEEGQRLYNTWGALNYETGNYHQAKNYFLKALEALPFSNPYYTDLMVNYKINLAHIHFRLEEYEEANKIYKSLLPLGKNLNEIYLNLGLINLNLGAPATALSWLRKVAHDNSKPVRLYDNMGNAFLDLKQYDSARRYFDRALSAANKGTDYLGYGFTLKSLGDLESATGSPAKALRYYAAAMHRFYPAYTDTTVTSNPEHFTGVFSYINLFNVLLAKAEALHRLYEQTANPSWAQEELEAYQSAFSLVEYVERTYTSDEARLFINKIKYEAHNRPIDIAFALYRNTGKESYLHALYQLDQQNKASVLALNQQLAEQRLTKDSSTAQQERALKTAITRLSLQAAQVNDSVQLAALNSQIRDHEIGLAKVQNRLAGVQAAGGRIPPIAFLQRELLDPSTALVSYHLSADKLTTLVITQKEVTGFQQALPPSFHEEIASFIQSFRGHSPTDYAPVSQKLHHLLFQNLPSAAISRLLIIPDDELAYLPFESLQDQKGQYVIETYSVQYQYSTALLKKQTTDFSGHGTLAFAPFSHKAMEDSRSSFDVLPYSGKEIERLAGARFTNTEATKSAFLQNVSQYKVVHLATHAVAGEDAHQSFIVFNGAGTGSNRLYASEIHNLSLDNTELVILSACETGSGNLVRGEGVMSLSRAFTYAGCPNIITSLWKADDFSTAYLTQKIHHYLENNYPADRAVQQAKRDYLADGGINPRLKHPFYWSHLVFIGHYSPEPSFTYLYLMGATALAGLGLFAYFHFKRRTSRSRPRGTC